MYWNLKLCKFPVYFSNIIILYRQLYTQFREMSNRKEWTIKTSDECSITEEEILKMWRKRGTDKNIGVTTSRFYCKHNKLGCTALMKIDMTDDGKRVYYMLNDHCEACISAINREPIREKICAQLELGVKKPFSIQCRLKSEGCVIDIKKIYSTVANMKRKVAKVQVT
jgi:hypothetical protein